MKGMVVTIMLGVVLMSALPLGSSSRVEKRDIFKHMSNLKSGLIRHFSRKFKNHRKFSSTQTFPNTSGSPGTRSHHMVKKSYNRSTPSPSNSISISSHAFLTPRFYPSTSAHTAYKHSSSRGRSHKHKDAGNPRKVSVTRRYKQQHQKHQRKKYGVKTSQTGPEILDENVPVYVPIPHTASNNTAKVLERPSGDLEESQIKRRFGKLERSGLLKEESEDGILKENVDEELEFFDTPLFREDLVGKRLR